MGKRHTFKIVSETCPTVHARVANIDFANYLDMLETHDKEDVLRMLAREAADIAQEYGATVVRETLGDEIENLHETIGDLENRIKELERENLRLGDEIFYLKETLKETERQ